MEKEVIWTQVALDDFWEIVTYLKEAWPERVLDRFHRTLAYKTHLLQNNPHLGYKSKKYSQYRRTLVTLHYVIIYSVTRKHIVIHRLKHVRMK